MITISELSNSRPGDSGVRENSLLKSRLTLSPEWDLESAVPTGMASSLHLPPRDLSSTAQRPPPPSPMQQDSPVLSTCSSKVFFTTACKMHSNFKNISESKNVVLSLLVQCLKSSYFFKYLFLAVAHFKLQRNSVTCLLSYNVSQA